MDNLNFSSQRLSKSYLPMHFVKLWMTCIEGTRSPQLCWMQMSQMLYPSIVRS